MRRLIGLGLVVLVIVVLGVAQLVLPGIATQRLHDQLARSGQVLSVRVRAFPAIKLLWNHADEVDVRMASYRQLRPSRLGTRLAQAGRVGTVNASAQEFTDGRLTLHDASLTKRGDQLTARARVDEADLRAAVPILDSMTPVASSGGQLVLRGTASVFGLTGSVNLTVAARNGRLVVTPDLPLFPTLTLFHQPGIEVTGVSAAPVTGGFVIRGLATVR